MFLKFVSKAMYVHEKLEKDKQETEKSKAILLLMNHPVSFWLVLKMSVFSYQKLIHLELCRTMYHIFPWISAHIYEWERLTHQNLNLRGF